MTIEQLEEKRYQDAKDRQRLDELTEVTPFKAFGEQDAQTRDVRNETREDVYDKYKPVFRPWEDDYTNARRIREIIRGVRKP